MKTSVLYGAAATLVTLVAASMSGQTETTSDSSGSSSYIQTSKLVGRKVESSQGEEIGVIKDVVLDRSNGCMAYTVLSIGGAGAGVARGDGKIVAVPWTVYSPRSDLSVLTVNIDRRKIYNAPVFDYARMDEYARPDYINNVYKYYGVSPGRGTRVAASTGTTAATDVTGTAGPTATPGEVASPTAARTESSHAGASAHPRASAAASPYGAANASPSSNATRGARARGTPPPTGRGETALPATTEEESPSEKTSSPSEGKKSRRNATEGTSTSRPSATPESSEGQD